MEDFKKLAQERDFQVPRLECRRCSPFISVLTWSRRPGPWSAIPMLSSGLEMSGSGHGPVISRRRWGFGGSDYEFRGST